MGTSSGGLWNERPLRGRKIETKNIFIFKNVLFSAFTAAILCSIVLCKQHNTRYSYETKRLSYKLHDNAIYEYSNSHKILRPKRDIKGGFKNMKTILQFAKESRGDDSDLSPPRAATIKKEEQLIRSSK